MRSTSEVADEWIANSVTVCSLFDVLIDAELNKVPPAYTGERPTVEALTREVRSLLKAYALEVVAECEGAMSDVRTTLKYDPQDMV